MSFWLVSSACLLLSIGTSVLHYERVAIKHEKMAAEWSRNIVNGIGPYPDQYRPLVHLILSLWCRLTNMRFGHAQLIFRTAATMALMLAIYYYISVTVSPLFGWLAVVTVYAVLPQTYLFIAYQPTDVPVAALFAAYMLSVATNQPTWLLFVVVVVASFTREVAVFMPLLYLTATTPPTSTSLALAAGMEAVSVGIVVAIRLYYGPRPAYAPTNPLFYALTNIKDWKAGAQVASFASCAGLVLCRPGFVGRANVHELGVVAMAVLVYTFTGYWREVRYLLPFLPVLLEIGFQALRASGVA